ncbi:MAG: isopentenyl phosphate kinase [Fervidicoccaceae archaeon]
MERLAVKLGGSLITDKGKPMRVRARVVRRLSRELETSWRRGSRLVVVHGGGSFGHYAVEHEIKEKGKLDVDSVPKISGLMRRLNAIVAESMEELGLPILVFHPSSSCYFDCERGALECNYEAVVRAFERGHVPLLHGDAVYPVGDCAPMILSGDELTMHLALLTRSELVVFAMDVPGILVPSRGRRERVLRTIQPEELRRLAKSLGRRIGGVYDVTGGIAAKLEVVAKYIERGYSGRVLFTTGLKPGNLERALTGEPVIGTLLEARRT